MISEGVKKYCKDDISLIENYDKAIADKDNIWDCHHRKETIVSKKELLEHNEYFNRPASELIFLTHSEHMALHNTLKFKGKPSHLKGKPSHLKGKHLSEETKQKISIAKKGNKYRLGKPFTEEAKQKLSDAFKGLHWFNNGIISVRAKSCPEGFVKGRLKKAI